MYLMTDGVDRACGLLPIKLDVCPVCGGGIKPTRGWQWINPQPFIKGRPNAEGFCSLGRLECARCYESWGEKAGLLWIGGAYYPTPADWQKEATRMGVSRRIIALPKGFKVGTTWVFVGHRKAIEKRCPGEQCEHGKCWDEDGWSDCPVCKGEGHIYGAAIFHGFKPDRIEYVVTPNDERLLGERERARHTFAHYAKEEQDAAMESWAEKLLPEERKALAKLDRMEERGIMLVRIEKVGANGELLPADAES
jgi:hypothetical protein